MLDLTIKPLTDEKEELINFMCSNVWPFHAETRSNAENIVKAFDKGWYSDDRETFWIENGGVKVGLIIIHDISDTIPLFDLRLSEEARGRGIGTKALAWLKGYIFTRPDKKIRIEAHTRVDNVPMRKTLGKAGFVKEGYLRQAWENADGTISDSICYIAIRSDWENKTMTPIKLDEVSF